MKKISNLVLTRLNLYPIFFGILIFSFVRLFVWIQFDFSGDLYSGDSGYYYDVALNIFNFIKFFIFF